MNIPVLDIQVGKKEVGLYNFRRSNFSNKSHRGIKRKQKKNKVSRFTLRYSAKRAKFSPEYHVYKNHDISSDNSTAKVNNNSTIMEAVTFRNAQGSCTLGTKN